MTREANQTLARVEAAGRRGFVLRADLGHAAEAQGLVAEGIRHFGRLDILVNNAGVEKEAPFTEVTEADYDRVLDINLKGAFFAAQAMARHLIETARPGKIINISSVHEEMGATET